MPVKLEIKEEEYTLLDDSVKKMYTEPKDGISTLDIKGVVKEEEFLKIKADVVRYQTELESSKKIMSSFGEYSDPKKFSSLLDEHKQMSIKIGELEKEDGNKDISTEKLEEYANFRLNEYKKEVSPKLEKFDEALEEKENYRKKWLEQKLVTEVTKHLPEDVITNKYAFEEAIEVSKSRFKYNDTVGSFIDADNYDIATSINMAKSKGSRVFGGVSFGSGVGNTGEGNPSENPFVKGAGYNVTKQAQLWNKDADLARRMKKQAEIINSRK